MIKNRFIDISNDKITDKEILHLFGEEPDNTILAASKKPFPVKTVVLFIWESKSQKFVPLDKKNKDKKITDYKYIVSQ